MRWRPSTDRNIRWKAPPLLNHVPLDEDGSDPFPLELINPAASKARTFDLANAVIGISALLLAALLVLAHTAGVAKEVSLPAHVQLAGVLLTIAMLAGLGHHILRAARPEPTEKPALSRHSLLNDEEEVSDALSDRDRDREHDQAMHELLREKQAAEAANAAKSRYLASVSHEIRTPLNAIYGYAQLMERGGDVDPGEAARVIRRSAEHLTNLVEGLLDISLIENGMLRVGSETVRLGPFLDQLASMFRHSATAKGLTFHFERPKRLPEFVRMDEKRLRQVLINLLSNAVKFTSSGSITFRMTWAGQVAVFEVCDTGPGIPVEDRERIFLPFERGSGAARNQPGIGLGLAITDALVRIQGGDLAMDSDVGTGTTFRVRMMLNQVMRGLPEKAATSPIIGYGGRRRSILVADDDIHQLRLMRGFLEPLGFEVVAVASGEDAIAQSVMRRFDLALLDISMPGMSGWDAARRLRADHGNALPIAMLSGNAMERHGPEGDEEPVHDLFLTKPVDLNALADAVGSLLSLEWTHEAVAVGDGDGDGETGTPVAQPATHNRLPKAALPHADKLRELIRIGHVRGIEGEIRSLADVAPESRDMIARLYACLDRFDLPAIRDTLDEYQ